MGGAVFNDGGTVTITNSTLTGNTAQGGTGANNGEGLGGAIFSLNGTLNTLNATISSNSANAADGIYVYGDNATATATINNTIIGQSTNTTSDFAATANGEGDDSTSGVGNLIRSATNFSGTIVSTANPLLGSLANNTGPTLTMLPADGSPAIDAGNNAAAADLTTDQRGLSRISNGTVDIGAVEVQAGDCANDHERRFHHVRGGQRGDVLGHNDRYHQPPPSARAVPCPEALVSWTTRTALRRSVGRLRVAAAVPIR